MNIFLTGATGYIGGSVARNLVRAGHQVLGLARSSKTHNELTQLGVEPLAGSLDDASILIEAASRADAVINAAQAGHRGAAETLIAALRGTGKLLIHTSGSSILADDAAGEPSDRVFTEDDPFTPVPEKVPRAEIDRLILGAAADGIRSVVICPSLVYGRGSGIHNESVQIPALARQAMKSGVARYIGRGMNIWSNVHIDDVADAYLLALDRAVAGSFFFLENGEASMRDVVNAISCKLGLGEAQSWSLDDAIKEWGNEAARFSLASNSRIRGVRTRRDLGWNPNGPGLADAIGASLPGG